MVRAVAALSRKGLDVAAVVVGPDEGFASTLRRIAADERFDHFYLVPAVSGLHKWEAFASADVLVYAAEVEDFGIVAFEGILFGIPTVVSAGTGCGEIVSRLNAGILVEYGNVEQLQTVLRHILEAPAEARERTQAARPRVIAALDWASTATRVRRVYEEVCLVSQTARQ